MISPKTLVERKRNKDNSDVKSLESQIDKFLETNFDGTREVAFDFQNPVSEEAINQLIKIYEKEWKVYYWTGSQRDSCSRLIFNYQEQGKGSKK